MRKPIIGAAAAATLALGGTAVAASGDPEEPVSVGLFSGNPEREFAQDLAEELGGEVSAEQVEDALEAVHESRMAEHRAQMGEQIAGHLDGVSAEAVAEALAVVDERMAAAFADGEPPEPGLFAQVLAEELGVGEAEITAALEAVREDQLGDVPGLHLEEGAPAPLGGPDGPPQVEFAFPAPPRD